MHPLKLVMKLEHTSCNYLLHPAESTADEARVHDACQNVSGHSCPIYKHLV